ncbi:4Fe-4S dicluster domain-containing protein [Deinococcus sp. KNUC1210]|uniref:heterodisulfide reductase-related iron-sulfur binding cluster n=1 Tax=Deinococcus sp. KNUC1210 TaxID=2917691 RepID=UPI001EF02925|nr:heterodisulfide reductase-related iron-sulfur binding cluster [Deinococcus sp. KNUC1210]ULH14682.1 4Fe-4S dicluster domain-containing protein [Deinococcus sp. KNUC1210]
MKNDIAAHHPDAQGELMAHAVDACVHCGFCLPACPTYQVLGDEMDSPRGRIILMKEVLEGQLPLFEATPHLDRCLGCVGCVTACPSGVPYGELITAFRGWSEPQRTRPVIQQLTRAAVLTMLPRPALFRAGANLGKWVKPLAPALPQVLRAPLDLLPSSVQPAQPTPALTPARGAKRGRVAFLVGCAQQVLTPNFNAATLRVLARNGIEVVAPQEQGCCGAAAMHTGARSLALEQARRNLRAFDPGAVDAVLSNAAGCGAGLKEYPMLLAGEPDAPRPNGSPRRCRTSANIWRG